MTFFNLEAFFCLFSYCIFWFILYWFNFLVANCWKYIYRFLQFISFFFFLLLLINFLLSTFATESQELKIGEIGSIIHGTWSFLYHAWKYKSTEGKKAESLVNMLDWDSETWILFLLCPTWPWANSFLCAFVQHGDSHTFSPIMLCFFQLWSLDSQR